MDERKGVVIQSSFGEIGSEDRDGRAAAIGKSLEDRGLRQGSRLVEYTFDLDPGDDSGWNEQLDRNQREALSLLGHVWIEKSGDMDCGVVLSIPGGRKLARIADFLGISDIYARPGQEWFEDLYKHADPWDIFYQKIIGAVNMQLFGVESYGVCVPVVLGLGEASARKRSQQEVARARDNLTRRMARASGTYPHLSVNRVVVENVATKVIDTLVAAGLFGVVGLMIHPLAAVAGIYIGGRKEIRRLRESEGNLGEKGFRRKPVIGEKLLLVFVPEESGKDQTM